MGCRLVVRIECLCVCVCVCDDISEQLYGYSVWVSCKVDRPVISAPFSHYAVSHAVKSVIDVFNAADGKAWKFCLHCRFIICNLAIPELIKICSVAS
jgi:hypothetical protein